MRGTVCAATLGLACLASALHLVKKDDPAVVEAGIQRKQSQLYPQERDRLRRRQNTVGFNLENDQTLYFANVSLGTPAQNLRLHIDTGSSDLWANSAQSDLCESQFSACRIMGIYSANRSSTYDYLNNDFNITYVDGSGAAGDYATDVLAIGDVIITDFEFGIGYVSSSQEGILGIGYPINEVIVHTRNQRPYPNLPVAMVNAGLISTPAYSLYLNDLDASTGSILFGGVNTAKYTGQLYTLPVIPEARGVYAEFIVGLTGVGTNGRDNSVVSNQAIPVLLDSGSSLTYLPDNIAQTLFTQFGAQYNSEQQTAAVDCGLADQQGSVDFTFAGPTISVALSELVLVGSVRNGRPSCIFGIAPSGSTTPVLGDTFLRSAYVVYDLQNNTISLAQSNYNATGNDIQEITSTSGVPDTTVVQNAITSVGSLQTGGVHLGGGIRGPGNAAAMATPAPMAKYGAVAAAGLGMFMAI